MTAKRYKKLFRAFYTFMYIDSQDSDTPITAQTFNRIIKQINTNVSRTTINGVPCTRDFLADITGVKSICKMRGDSLRKGGE